MNLLTHIIGAADYLELETSLEKPFPMPVEFVSQTAISRLTRIVKWNVHHDQALDSFVLDLRQNLGPDATNPVVRDETAWENALKVLSMLYQHLLELHENDRDEFWAPIIENRFAPLFLGKFDLVVGNPPWVSWNRLPVQWRRKAEDIWRQYGLWDPPKEPGVSGRVPNQIADIATLVAAISLDRYLHEDGVLAFVMPKSVIRADPGNRAFRQYHLRGRGQESRGRKVDICFSPLAVHDFSEVEPFRPDASNEPIVMVLQRGRKAEFPIPGSRWFRGSAGGRITPESWGVVSQLDLRREDVSWAPVNAGFTPSPLAWWRRDEKVLHGPSMPYTFGKGLDTRGANGVYFLEPLSQGVENGCLRVANRPGEGKKREVSSRGPKVFSADVELLVPLVRGRDVKNFSVTPSGYILLPYHADRVSVLNHQRLSQYRSTFEYLKAFKDVLLNRPRYQSFQPTEDCWWQLHGGHHMSGRFLVCVTEVVSGRPQCAVLTARWDDRLQQTIMPVVDHKVTFFSTDNETLAYYLCGMINSHTVQEFLGRFANITAMSPQTLRRLPIPSFRSDNVMQCRIGELSMRAHRSDGEERRHIVTLIDELVAFFLGNESTATKEPRKDPRRGVAAGVQLPNDR